MQQPDVAPTPSSRPSDTVHFGGITLIIGIGATTFLALGGA